MLKEAGVWVAIEAKTGEDKESVDVALEVKVTTPKDSKVLLGKRSRGSETGRENNLWGEELLPGPSCEDDETSSGIPSTGQRESLFPDNPAVLLALSRESFLEETGICI